MIEPPWYKIALGELGVQEIAGDLDNPRIVEYLQSVFKSNQHDEVAWCSAFVNWSMLRSGFWGTFSALARSWLDWGIPLSAPVLGAVLVFRRGKESWMGHTCFFAGYDGSRYKALGGNQQNKVCFASYPISDCIGIRWPANYKEKELKRMRALLPTGQPDIRIPWTDA